MSASRHWSPEIQLSNFWDSLSEPARQPISNSNELEQLVFSLQPADANEFPDSSFRYQLRERFATAELPADHSNLVLATSRNLPEQVAERSRRLPLVAAVVAGLLLATGLVVRELDLTSRFDSDRSTVPAVAPAGSASPAMYLGGPGRTGDIDAIGPVDSPAVVWTYESGASIQAAPIAVDGTVYVGNTDGTFMAIDLDSGDEAWSVETGGSIQVAAAINGNVVYVASGSYGGGGWVIAFDRFTGSELWRQELQDGIWSSPAILDGAMYLATLDGTIYSIDLITGIANWTFKAGGSVIDPVAVSDQVLAAVSDDGVLTVLDPQSGHLLWNWSIPEEERGGAPSALTIWKSPLIIDGRVIVNYGWISQSNRNQRVRSFEAVSGKEQWSYGNPNLSVVLGDNQYVAHNTLWTFDELNRTWLGLDLASGELIGELLLQQVSGGVQNTVLSELAVFSTTWGTGHLYAHDSATGELLWRLPVQPPPKPGEGYGSTLPELYEPVAAQGMLVIGMQSGHLLAIGDQPTEPDDG